MVKIARTRKNFRMVSRNVLKKVFYRLPLSDRNKIILLAFVNPPCFPQSLNIEPTVRCNLKCVMCGGVYWDRNQKKDMDFDFFKKIVSQFPPLQRITIQGLGEPLLNHDLLKMVSFARALGIYTRFNSNLLLLNEEKARKLVECGHSEITISLETINPELYASIRIGSRLDKVLKNIKLIQKTKERMGSKYPMLAIHGVLMKITADYLFEFVQEAKKLGVSHISFADMNTDGLDLSAKMLDGTSLGENTFSSLSENKRRAIFNKIKTLETHDFKVLLPHDWGGGMKGKKTKSNAFLTCRELWEEPYVTCDGFMTPCCFKPDQTLFNMGDFSRKTFEDIWFGQKYQMLRKQHLTNNHPDFCKNCQQLCLALAPWSCSDVDNGDLKYYQSYFLGNRPFTSHCSP